MEGGDCGLWMSWGVLRYCLGVGFWMGLLVLVGLEGWVELLLFWKVGGRGDLMIYILICTHSSMFRREFWASRSEGLVGILSYLRGEVVECGLGERIKISNHRLVWLGVRKRVDFQYGVLMGLSREAFWLDIPGARLVVGWGRKEFDGW